MKIAILGAGSVGTYVGGALLARGADLILIGRARMQSRLNEFGLTLTDLAGVNIVHPPGSVPYAQDPVAMADAGLILVTVKSADTDSAAALIAAHAAPGALVVSLQNGVGNAQRLRAALPNHTVLAGMVPFNVVQLDANRLHRGTAGEIMIEISSAIAPWLPAFAAAGLPLLQQADFDSIQWGKLLINLNNAVNALSGIPLQREFSQRGFRRCLAALIDEGRTVLEAAGIHPAKVVKLGPRMLPLVLRLPDGLFRRIAAPMLRIDPEARSSMWEDLEAGRRTEIDYLNGAVVALAASIGRKAPFNERIVTLIRAAEQGARSSISGDQLYAMLKGRQ
ncbi:MAG: 2-dehydropantoate 2-reductase [Herminiimonas sp.]|nr:2-dehydropantoate 2-reductase [Herminiimonas sp.]